MLKRAVRGYELIRTRMLSRFDRFAPEIFIKKEQKNPYFSDMKLSFLRGKNLLISSSFIFFILSCPGYAEADLSRICTPTGDSNVVLRKGPGINYSRGLASVGSGGPKVDRYFRQRNYTISAGEPVSVFSSIRDREGRMWHQVGTNQWTAWVRSDFVCRHS